MKNSSYDKWLERSKNESEIKQLFLPKDEYAKVISEFNTNMSDEDRMCRIVTKPIGDYFYTIINNGFNDYMVIGKRPIVEKAYDLWEEDNE